MLSFSGLGWRQTNMKRIFLAAALLAGFLGGRLSRRPKSAIGTSRSARRTSIATPAVPTRTPIADQNVIVFTYSKDAIVLVLIHEGWEWGKDDKILKADFGTDKATIIKMAKWEVMFKTTMARRFRVQPVDPRRAWPGEADFHRFRE
jgi:hypothetical protein